MVQSTHSGIFLGAKADVEIRRAFPYTCGLKRRARDALAPTYLPRTISFEAIASCVLRKA
jgi:hypothetical protein